MLDIFIRVVGPFSAPRDPVKSRKHVAARSTGEEAGDGRTLPVGIGRN